MSYLVNFHAHTRMSDGCNTMLEMALQAADLGHCSLVVTDHDYFLAWPRNREILATVRQQSPIPIILGSEIVTPIGECLMFGESNLRRWFEKWDGMSKMRAPSPQFLHTEFADQAQSFFSGMKREDCPLILCHPFAILDRAESYGKQEDNFGLSPWNRHWLRKLRDHDQIARLLVGYEGRNARALFPKDRMDWSLKDIWAIDGLKRYYNSDAHTREMLSIVCNEVPHPITNEAELIEYLVIGGEPQCYESDSQSVEL